MPARTEVDGRRAGRVYGTVARVWRNHEERAAWNCDGGISFEFIREATGEDVVGLPERMRVPVLPVRVAVAHRLDRVERGQTYVLACLPLEHEASISRFSRIVVILHGRNRKESVSEVVIY